MSLSALFDSGPALRATMILLAIVWSGHGAAAAENPGGSVAERLRARIEEGGHSTALWIGTERVHARTELPRFYERRGFATAWIDGASVGALADSMIVVIERLGTEGLDPSHYHLSAIRRLRDRFREPARLSPVDRAGSAVDLELLLTDAFLIAGAHLLAGRVNPETFDPEWKAAAREVDLVTLLETVLAAGSPTPAFRELLPHHSGYARLRDALNAYRGLAENEGWPPLPDGPTLRPGDENARVPALRQRLRTTGDLPAAVDTGAARFDEPLGAAVRRFQQRHGLEADGLVGPATRTALNMPARDRARQIELNLERWRWLPQELGGRYVIVNIANFELDLVESGVETLTLRVVVGRNYRRTPVFSDRISYLVLSPYWNVPPMIATKDILPAVRRDVSHFERMKIRVFSGWGADARELDPRQIDWGAVSAARFPYRLRQDPGPGNALGEVKFMFPNTFNVYLHDTSARDLFARTERTFSSGCIRVEHALDLAEKLLGEDRAWTRARIESAVAERVERTVTLPRPLPIHLLYWTAWVDDVGTVHFRNDIYGRDSLLDAALRQASAEAQGPK